MATSAAYFGNYSDKDQPTLNRVWTTSPKPASLLQDTVTAVPLQRRCIAAGAQRHPAGGPPAAARSVRV